MSIGGCAGGSRTGDEARYRVRSTSAFSGTNGHGGGPARAAFVESSTTLEPRANYSGDLELQSFRAERAGRRDGCLALPSLPGRGRGRGGQFLFLRRRIDRAMATFRRPGRGSRQNRTGRFPGFRRPKKGLPGGHMAKKKNVDAWWLIDRRPFGPELRTSSSTHGQAGACSTSMAPAGPGVPKDVQRS